MRADDIRALVVEQADKAVAECAKVSERQPELAEEAGRYVAAAQGLADFWRTASPAFCHAWFAVVSEEVNR